MTTSARALRSCAAVLATAALAAGLAACVAEPEPGATGGPTGAGTGVPTRPSVSATPTATSDADVIALPGSCEQIYSADMLATLNSQTPPLNDPGVTMLSSQIVESLEVLNSGAPTIRCSWGTPSESGMSTNVTLVDAAQSQSVIAGLQNSGFACADARGGMMCTFEQEQLTQDDTIVTRGETHLLRGNGWVATSWVSVNPDGYTDDIAATLWG